MRRAQIEMMGLVVIVILVTIGLFFSIALRSTPSPRPLSQAYGSETLASNYLITLLETQIIPGQHCGTPSNPLTVRDLAIDCVRYNTSLGLSSWYTCGGDDSCQAFETITNDILAATLDQWHLTYNLTYAHKTNSGTTTLFTLGDSCNRYDAQAAPGVQQLSLYRVTSGTAILTLRLCD